MRVVSNPDGVALPPLPAFPPHRLPGLGEVGVWLGWTAACSHSIALQIGAPKTAAVM